jgi:hypothetical protein
LLAFCLALILENWRQKIKIGDFFGSNVFGARATPEHHNPNTHNLINQYIFILQGFFNSSVATTNIRLDTISRRGEIKSQTDKTEGM